MAGFKFVGFQEHVEIPAGHSQISVQEEIHSALGKDATFSMLSEPQLISSWFVNVSSLQTKQGGKFNYTSATGSGEGVCLAAVMGREIALLADEFGEFRAKVNQSGDDVTVSVAFNILTDVPDAKRAQLENYISNLKAVLK